MEEIITNFDTSGKKMIQDFSKRVRLIVDFGLGFIIRYIDGKEEERIGFEKCYTLLDFINYQEETLKVAQSYSEQVVK